jgi:hypothetical protein
MPQVLDFQEFYAFYSAYSAYAEMYRKNEVFACKNRAKWVGWRTWVGGFSAYAEMRKEFYEVLDFQRFPSFRKFSASFPQAFRKLAICYKRCYNKITQRINSLIFNALLDVSKRLISNGFTHLYGAGRVGQG